MAPLSVRRRRRLLQRRPGRRKRTTPEVTRSTLIGGAMRVWQCSNRVAHRAPLHTTGRIYPDQGGRGPLVGLVGRLAEYHVHHGRSDAREEDGINVLHRHNGYLLHGLFGIAGSLWLGWI